MDKSINIANQRQLFVDGLLVSSLSGAAALELKCGWVGQNPNSLCSMEMPPSEDWHSDSLGWDSTLQGMQLVQILGNLSASPTMFR